MLSPAFMNPDIIVGLVYEHTTMEPMVIQKLDEGNTLLVFAEGENIEKLCRTLQSIEIWLGHSVNTGCNDSRRMSTSGGEEESVLVEGASMQLPRPMLEPQCDISSPSVALQVVGKMPNFSTFSGDYIQKGEVSFEQWAFEVRSMMQSHTEATLKEGIVQSLHGAVADLVCYLVLQALVAEIIKKLELVYGTVANCDILMQNLYKL